MIAGEQQDALDARRDQPAGLELVQVAQAVRPAPRGPGDVDELPADHALHARRAGQLAGGGEHIGGLAPLA